MSISSVIAVQIQTIVASGLSLSSSDLAASDNGHAEVALLRYKTDDDETTTATMLLLCTLFVDESTRRKEVRFVLDRAVLVIARRDEDVQVLSLALVREVVRAARQDRDERTTKANVECRVDDLKGGES